MARGLKKRSDSREHFRIELSGAVNMEWKQNFGSNQNIIAQFLGAKSEKIIESGVVT